VGTLREWLDADKPFLGICVGYQLLFEVGEESPGVKGFGFFKGRVQKFHSLGLRFRKSAGNGIETAQHPLWQGLPANAHVYYVHSYFPKTNGRSMVIARTTYGETFAAACAARSSCWSAVSSERARTWVLSILRNFAHSIHDSTPSDRPHVGRSRSAAPGQADDKTVYSRDPAAFAQNGRRRAAIILHLVDLDAAFAGEPRNLDSVRAVCERVSIPVELGGGMRTESAIRDAIDAGVDRVIIGTRAAESLDFVRNMARTFGSERVAVGSTRRTACRRERLDRIRGPEGA
jgi:hypothetical protein